MAGSLFATKFAIEEEKDYSFKVKGLGGSAEISSFAFVMKYCNSMESKCSRVRS